MMRLEGKTQKGRTVAIEPGQRDRRGQERIWIDGNPVEVKDYRLYRDGGTQVYVTTGGTITLARRMNKPFRDLLDGEELEPMDRT